MALVLAPALLLLLRGVAESNDTLQVLQDVGHVRDGGSLESLALREAAHDELAQLQFSLAGDPGDFGHEVVFHPGSDVPFGPLEPLLYESLKSLDPRLADELLSRSLRAALRLRWRWRVWCEGRRAWRAVPRRTGAASFKSGEAYRVVVVGLEVVHGVAEVVVVSGVVLGGVPGGVVGALRGGARWFVLLEYRAEAPLLVVVQLSGDRGGSL
jgi:hypothetical protein